MRLKRDPQLYLSWAPVSDRKIVKQFRRQYKKISDLLDANPRILDRVNQDLQKLCSSSRRGRKAEYTSEMILRALIVHCLGGEGLRDTIVRIAESDTLREFVRLGNRDVMDFTFLDKCFCAIRPDTWRAVNDILAGYGIKSKHVDTSQLRTDTTVTEATMHYPTDSSLLWDSWRVLTRLIKRAKAFVPEIRLHRFHARKVKGHHLFITRYASSKSKRRARDVKRRFRVLIESVERVSGIAERVCAAARIRFEFELDAIAEELAYYLPAVRTVKDAAKRANLGGEKVPASDRVFSIFEQHAELIKRGRREKPVEFGHKVLLAQTADKFILHYDALEKQEPENHLLDGLLERHQKMYGEYPKVVAADHGFWPEPEKKDEWDEKVQTLAIPKKVGDWKGKVLSVWQAFRAGIEGSISVLKRAFRLLRCSFRGFKNFSSSIGLSVFCHNLLCLART